MISSGELNKRIRIEKVIKHKNNFGEYIPELKTFIETWATIKQSSNSGDNKEIQNQRLINRNQKLFNIRFIHNLSDDMIIVYRDKNYSIENINNVDEKDIEIEILGQLIED